MIYCREKLIDIILEDPWVSLEDKFDFDISLKTCLQRGLFTNSEWQDTEEFLATGNNFNPKIEKVILVLANELGYSDDRFLNGQPELVQAVYYSLNKGERL